MIIMAAGKGSRLGNTVPKPLSIITNNESILSKITGTILKLKPARIIIVVGYKAKDIISHINNHYKIADNISFTIQEPLNGTLGAVEVGMRLIPNKLASVLILPADNGWFLKAETLQSLINRHFADRATVSILLSSEFDDSLHKVEYLTSEKRVLDVRLRTKGNDIDQTYLAGTGIICLEKEYFTENKHLIKPLPNGEYNISRIIEIALAQEKVVGYVVADKNEIMTINTKKDLEKLMLLANC